MKLYCDPTSPTTRRIVVTAIEAGLTDLDVIDVRKSDASAGPSPEQFLDWSPSLEDGSNARIVGVEEICAWLDSRHERPKMMPDKGEARLEIRQLDSCADELIDAALALYRELQHVEPQRWNDEMEAQRQRMAAALDTLESLTDTVLVGPITLGHIAAACALAWLDHYLPSEDWRPGRPTLTDWYGRFKTRPSMQATQPAPA